MLESYNHVEQHSELLQRRLDELVAIDQPWQNEERRAAVRREMTLICLEQIAQYSEARGESVAESWKEYGGLV